MNIYKRIAETDGLVSDVDGVLYKVDLRLRIPKDFLLFTVESISKGNIHAPMVYASLWGMKNNSRGKISNFKNSLYHLLAKDMTEDDIESAGKAFLEGHVDVGYKEFTEVFVKGGKPIVACSRNPTVKYIKPPNITDIVSNEMIFKNGVFERVELDILDGNDKKKKVDKYLRKKYASSLKRFTYLGDANQDIIPGEEAAVFLASPYATKNCKKECIASGGVVIDDYSRFARRLQEEMPKVQ